MHLPWRQGNSSATLPLYDRTTKAHTHASGVLRRLRSPWMRLVPEARLDRVTLCLVLICCGPDSRPATRGLEWKPWKTPPGREPAFGRVRVPSDAKRSASGGQRCVRPRAGAYALHAPSTRDGQGRGACLSPPWPGGSPEPAVLLHRRAFGRRHQDSQKSGGRRAALHAPIGDMSSRRPRVLLGISQTTGGTSSMVNVKALGLLRLTRGRLPSWRLS